MTFSGTSQGVLEVVGLQPIALPPGPRSVSMHHLISRLVLLDYPYETWSRENSSTLIWNVWGDIIEQIESTSLAVRKIILPLQQISGRYAPLPVWHDRPYICYIFVLSSMSHQPPTIRVELRFLHLVVNHGGCGDDISFLGGLILRLFGQQRNGYVRIGMFHYPLSGLDEYSRLLDRICLEDGENS